MSESMPFEQRLGIVNNKSVSNDFPESAKIALIYFLEDLVNKDYIIKNEHGKSWVFIFNELYRAGRIIDPQENWKSHHDELEWLLSQIMWYRIFTFCERIYSKLLQEVSVAKVYFTDELNQILLEENIDYKFENGQFEKRGRLNTQKNIKKMGAVLSDSNLSDVRKHYIKALNFFKQVPDPDYDNCVKEALCALELAVYIQTGKDASKNFTQAMKELEGKVENKIPNPISQSMIKIFAYRGGGKGVAHSAPEGWLVREYEAELILNLVASFITYIVDSYPIKDELPF